MKLMSLFDGSGGFPLAASLCGIDPVYASEVEPYPIAVTKSRFPSMKHLGDVSMINGADIVPVDIITFGSPCQDMSVAGKRAGLKHTAAGDDETTRSGLFLEAIRIIKEMRLATNGIYPRFAVWENVPGAFSSNRGEDFRLVLEEFIRISEPNAVMPAVPQAGWAYADCINGDGWSVAYRTFDAQYWGVPQRRRRIYLVADFRGQRAGEILLKPEGLRRNSAQSGTHGQETARCAKNSVGTAIGGVDRYNQSFLPGLAQTLRASGGGDCIPTVLAPVANAGDNRLAIVQPISDGGCSILFENHGRDCRYKGPLKVAQTVTATYGMGGNNTPFVVSVIETSETVHCYDIGEARLRTPSEYIEKSPTLRAEAHGNAPYVINKKTLVYDTRGNGAGETVPTITGDHNNRITDYTALCCEAVVYDGANITSPLNKTNPQAGDPCHTISTDSRNYIVHCLQGNGIDRADTAGCNGKGVCEDKCYTLNTIDRHAVCFPQQAYNKFIQEDIEATLKASGGTYGGGSENLVAEQSFSPIRYIVRRLTPTECARLQGFPDWWGEIPKKDNLTDDEYVFWLNVRNTYAKINNKTTKEYSKEQMLSWYNKLHSDSAEYKMWGNGIALPNALYVMQGIVTEVDNR